MPAEFYERVFRLFSETNMGNESLWWRTDGLYAPVTFMVNCSDTFFWGTADSEHLTPENISILEEAVRVCVLLEQTCTDPNNTRHRHASRFYATVLFCAKIRNMRPVRSAYPADFSEISALYDACGPERTRESEG